MMTGSPAPHLPAPRSPPGTHTLSARPLTYALAALVGIAAALAMLPVPAMLGAGPGWNPPGGDQAQSLAGHLAFQADAWRWPPLDARNLFWPRGISIALTDSNPLVSLLAKLWASATGGAPANLLGAFLAACWVLQPVAAAYAARGLGLRVFPAVVAGVLAVAWPALMVRMGHINLCGHFLVLLALGLALRRARRPAGRPGGWLAPTAVMTAAALVQPYLFELSAIVFASIPLHAVLARRAGWKRDAAGYLLGGVAAVGILTVLSGPLGGGDKGFVTFSMNLLSPVWPQHSGVFGAGLPTLDATGGQYEGFNWLGAGVLLLTAAALLRCLLARLGSVPPSARPEKGVSGLAVVLAGLALLSLSSRVYAGHTLLLDLGTKPWEDVFGTFRTPGRAFWPVGYAIMLGSVAGVAALPRRVGVPLLLAAVVLQVIDVRPLCEGARGAWNTGMATVAPAMPGGATLFTVAPFPGCAPEPSIKAEGPLMILDAVRHGARVGDIGIGRSPAWFSCERILTDALELPLAPGEARAFFGAAQGGLRVAALGPGALCRRDADAVLCGRGVAPFAGSPVPAGAPLFAPALPPDPAVPLDLSGAALAPALASFWRTGPGGEAWSEGPRSTLLFAVRPAAAPAGLSLVLHLAGIATRPGGTREIRVGVGSEPTRAFTLADGQPAELAVPVPAAAFADGVLRVAFDVVRPVDPARRGMAAPVRRAAIRLAGLTLRPN